MLELFAEYEMKQQSENPQQLYSSVLAGVARSIATRWQLKISDEEAETFGRSVSTGPNSRIPPRA